MLRSRLVMSLRQQTCHVSTTLSDDAQDSGVRVCLSHMQVAQVRRAEVKCVLRCAAHRKLCIKKQLIW